MNLNFFPNFYKHYYSKNIYTLLYEWENFSGPIDFQSGIHSPPMSEITEDAS